MTILHTIKPDGTYSSDEWTGELEYAAPPFRSLKSLLAQADPVHEGCDIEHVNVWWKGKLAHMFVDETGLYKPAKRNQRATRIYFNLTIKRDRLSPALIYDDLAKMPTYLSDDIQRGYCIVGVALLWEGDLE